ncbi:septum site-determining protein MinD [Alkalibaculum sp. M08DMB]|uniref:Septum site-determining protein MinD n=1 Tax=Alkalibaculum sporogenes TaxID=2655001 RepID=A0A6A7KB06_9FIRM|nr:septum site-determining protein MinD [Alkalibaculum sporogenes]MPW26594.1 septum site-determining protein MinD [Alkalibaculum sporogenes]
MGEVYVITSGKGGVGKTTTTANLGSALAMMEKRVVVIDADIGLRNLDVVMGLENKIVYNIVDIVEKRCRINQALIKDKRFEELYLLPAAQTNTKMDVKPDDMVLLCNELKEEFDYILIDCPAGIERGFENAIAGAEKSIVVTVPEVSAVRDADRIIGLLRDAGLNEIHLIINRVRLDLVKKGEMLSVDDMLDILAINLLGIIPDNKDIVITTNRGEPIVTNEKSITGQAYKNIAKRIMGEDIPFLELDIRKNFIQRLFSTS